MKTYMPSFKNLKYANVTIKKDHHIDLFLDLGIYGITSLEAINGALTFELQVLPGTGSATTRIQRQTIYSGGAFTVYERYYNGTAFGAWVAQTGVSPIVKFVSTVAELEAAIAIQTAGQFIYLQPGEYELTKELTPIVGADGGGLIGLGNVSIVGAAAADSAIHVIAYAAGTFEYTLGGSIEVQGGADKIALKLTNGAISQKVILYVNDDVHFIDNGTGIAVSAVNTGTGAMRIYASCAPGTGWDNMLITPKNADDKFHFRGISFDEDITITAVEIAANFWFENCKVPLGAKVVGGNATEVVNIVNCYTMTGAAVTAVAANTDFPDFSPTVV